MPLSTVLQWRTIAAMATASRISSSVRAVEFGRGGVEIDAVLAGDLSSDRQPDQLLGLAVELWSRIELERTSFPPRRRRSRLSGKCLKKLGTDPSVCSMSR